MKTYKIKKLKNPLPSLQVFSIEWWYFFVVFLFSARATILTSNLDPRYNPIGAFFYIVPAIFLIVKHKLSINKSLYVIYGVAGIWTFIQFITSAEFKVLEYIILFLNISVAYLIVAIYKKKTFLYFENITTGLAALSLPLWLLMHIVGASNMALLGLFQPASSTSLASYLIFNVPDVERYEDAGLFGLQRNCGFCWEPGLFASFLVMAIFFNLCRTKNNITSNPSLWILLAALFTTFSTTGYIALFVLLLTSLLYRSNPIKNKKIIIFLPLMAVVAYQAYKLPFIGGKIADRSNEENFVNDNMNKINTIESNDEQITVDRFEGMALDFLNYIDKPIFGYGLNRENSYVNNNISEKISISNGTVSVFAQYGSILGLLIYAGLILNSIYLRRVFKVKDKAFFWVLMTISFSYSFITIAMFMALNQYYLLSGCDKSLFHKKMISKKERRKKLIMKFLQEKQHIADQPTNI